jgi:hypothetical protein
VIELTGSELAGGPVICQKRGSTGVSIAARQRRDAVQIAPGRLADDGERRPFARDNDCDDFLELAPDGMQPASYKLALSW